MEKALLRLFNAIQIKEGNAPLPINGSRYRDILMRSIKNGYILDPSIVPNERLLNIVEDVIGISGEKANAAFHKSWEVVRNSSREQLVAQHILHYISTYGFEMLGIYNEGTVYIPSEVLELPDVKSDLPLTVVKGMTPKEIFESIINLGSVGIALSEETLQDIMDVVKNNRFNGKLLINSIKNRELISRLYNYYGFVPIDPTEFLRYVIGKLTGESLIIKNDNLISKIKNSDGRNLDRLLRDAPEDLASIFFRFKPLFLAMKYISRDKTFFNRLRKKANSLHSPMPTDYLNNVTSQIKRYKKLYTLDTHLKNATIFRKIRLAYALQNRLNSCDSIVYKIRNGKGWATEFTWPSYLEDSTEVVLETVLNSISVDIMSNVYDKIIYIPEYVHYTLPATEKQFTGNFPTGSSISVPEDMIVGIHWMNTIHKVDLDLSVIGESGKTGWDASYRSNNRRVLFSGDVTSAPKPNGASELFYLEGCQHEPRILWVNYFNFHPDVVPAKILVAHEKVTKLDKNYMIDVNNILATANINISKKQTMLGLIAGVDNDNRFYFSQTSVGNSISARVDRISTMSRKYLVNTLINSIDLKDVLLRAGAIITDKVPVDDDYIDLSPESLTKTTIINLLQSK